MPSDIVQDFDKYQVVYEALGGQQCGAGITLFHKGKDIGVIIFRQQLAAAHKNEVQPDGRVKIYLPLASFNDVYNILRSEAPMQLIVNSAGGAGYYAYIASKGMERVGEWSEV